MTSDSLERNTQQTPDDDPQETTDSTGGANTAVLQAAGVTVRFGGLTALSSVNLDVPRGAIVGLVGPNGAGKSTLFAVLSGLLRPNAGRVHLDGQDVTKISPQGRARKGMARTFQHPELFSSLTIREHLVLGHRLRHNRGRLWTDLVTGRGFRKPGHEETEHVDAILEMLHLGALAEEHAVGLPVGSCRLIEVGRALATNPKVLLLDEPGAGLDPSETEQLAAAFRRIVASDAVSIVMVEHDLEMVLGLSRLVYVLDFGVCIAQGSPAEIRSNERVHAAYLGDVRTSPTGQHAGDTAED
jgi:branched-chain amino acid transport system ATP-binding protein